MNKKLIALTGLFLAFNSFANDPIGGTLVYKDTYLTLQCLERDVDNKCIKAEVDTNFCSQYLEVNVSEHGQSMMDAATHGKNTGLANNYKRASGFFTYGVMDGLEYFNDNILPENTPDKVADSINIALGAVPFVGAVVLDIAKLPLVSSAQYVHQSINKKVIKKKLNFLLNESKVGKKVKISKGNMFHMLDVLEFSNR